MSDTSELNQLRIALKQYIDDHHHELCLHELSDEDIVEIMNNKLTRCINGTFLALQKKIKEKRIGRLPKTVTLDKWVNKD